MWSNVMSFLYHKYCFQHPNISGVSWECNYSIAVILSKKQLGLFLYFSQRIYIIIMTNQGALQGDTCPLLIPSDY